MKNRIKNTFQNFTTAVVGGHTIRRRMIYESDLEPSFENKITSLAHGEKLFSCIQCGTCSGTCPLSQYMDYTPRKIIAMVMEGFRNEVLNSMTIWLCASCYSCTVECPKQIKITDVMYALKREAISENVYPKHFPTPILANEFFKQVKRTGRNSETRLMINLYFKTNPLKMFGDALLGARLWLAGRLPLKEEGVRDKKDLKKLLTFVEKTAGEA